MASPVVRHRVKINQMRYFKNLPTDANCPSNRIINKRGFVQIAEELTRLDRASNLLDQSLDNELLFNIDAQMRKDYVGTKNQPHSRNGVSKFQTFQNSGIKPIEAPQIRVKVKHNPASKRSSKAAPASPAQQPALALNWAFNNDLGDIITLKSPQSLRRDKMKKLSTSLKQKMNNGIKDY